MVPTLSFFELRLVEGFGFPKIGGTFKKGLYRDYLVGI